MRTKFAMFVATLTVAASANANLITNGDFEAAGAQYSIPTSWSAATTGTTTDLGIGLVNYYGAGSTAKDGKQLVEFNGGNTAPNASLFQTFSTTAGAIYSVDFDYGVTTGGNQSLLAQILGSNGSTVLAAFTAHSTSTALDHFKFSFTADGGNSTIRFNDIASNDTTNQDGVLDNVSVVPEPGSIALLGLGLLGFMVARRKATK